MRGGRRRGAVIGLGLGLGLALLACARAGPRSPTAVAPWLRADPRRCLLQRDLREGIEIMARRCAEQFVRENGYTALPAEDSSAPTGPST